MSLISGDQSKSYLQKILQKLQGPNWLKVEIQSSTENITSTSNALDVNIKSGSLSAGTNIIGKVGIDQTTPGTTNGVVINNGNVGGFSEKLSGSITTSSTAYSINDNIGGIQTLTDLLRTSGGTGVLQGISLWSIANQKPNLIIDFFDSSPSGTYTNDSAQVIVGDHGKWLGTVEISISDWKDTGTISRATKTGLGIILKGSSSRNIYMTIQDKTGVTFGSTSGLFYKVGILRD